MPSGECACRVQHRWLLSLFPPESAAETKRIFLAVLLYGLNPLTLLSFLLNVSDGLALDLAVAGLVFLYGAGERERMRPRFLLLQGAAAWSLLAFSLLTKETLLAVIGGAFLATAVRSLRSGRVRWGELLFRGSPLLPLLLWWRAVGFTPGQAARRGGLPFQGVVEYLLQGDALLSGRSFLVLLLVLYMVLFVRFVVFFRSESAERREPHSLSAALPAGVLLLNVILVSFATGDEYWGNFANIARLYTPGLLSVVLWMAWPSRRDRGRDKTGKEGLARYGRGAVALFLLLFTLLLIRAESTGNPLPYFVRERGGYSP